MAQSFSCRPLTAVFRVLSQPVHVRFVVGRVALEQVYLRILRFSLVSIISAMLPIHFHINNTFIRTSGPSLWDPHKNCLAEDGKWAYPRIPKGPGNEW